MMSRTVAAGLLAAVTFTAVATGSYVAIRHNGADAVPAPPKPVPAAPAAQDPVKTETEAVVIPAVAEVTPATPAPAPIAGTEPVQRTLKVTRRVPVRRASREAAAAVATPASPDVPAPITTPLPSVAVPAERPADDVRPVVEVEEDRPIEPAVEEVIVPASAVIGLEIERTVTSEDAQVEDRVNARVTRDVYVDGSVAIPSNSQMIGTVTLVERGGKMKDRARLGVRFHTLVLADGRQIPLRTETVFREGDPPGSESSRKIGGAAIGGAVLGAILGGGKGAVAGAAAGAAGGTAVVMAGGRNAATLAGGSVLTVRLSAPVSVEVAR
jgi:hypothetical protein